MSSPLLSYQELTLEHPNVVNPRKNMELRCVHAGRRVRVCGMCGGPQQFAA